jgi:biopolymer transport protein ExbB
MRLNPQRITGAILAALIAALALPALAQTPPAAPAASPPATVAAQPAPAPPSPSPTGAPADNAQSLVPAASRPQRDMSPWTMFLAADIVVKAVMASLALASLVTWTIFFAKAIQLARAQRRLRGALARIADARTLSEAQMALNGGDTALSALVRAALHEARLSGEGASDAGIKERSASRFSQIARAEARAMRHGWRCSPPSARPRRSSGCSAPSGAS